MKQQEKVDSKTLNHKVDDFDKDEIIKEFVNRVRDKMNLQNQFYKNYPFAKKIIEEQSSFRMMRLIKLNPNKKELQTHKKIFSIILDRHIYNDLSSHADYKIFLDVLNSKDSFLSDAIYDYIENLVKGYFEIADLILSSFELSDKIFRKKIRSIQKKYVPIKKRADQMTAKKLTKEKEAEYRAILNKQKELIKKYGSNRHSSSLSNAIRQHHKNISVKKLKSIANVIRSLQKKGTLPK